MKKEKKEIKKLKEGDEVFFLIDGRQLMEKVTVESIDKKSGMALLSNRVKVARTLGPDNTYPRLDGKEAKVLDFMIDFDKKLTKIVNKYFKEQ